MEGKQTTTHLHSGLPLSHRGRGSGTRRGVGEPRTHPAGLLSQSKTRKAHGVQFHAYEMAGPGKSLETGSRLVVVRGSRRGVTAHGLGSPLG